MDRPPPLRPSKSVASLALLLLLGGATQERCSWSLKGGGGESSDAGPRVSGTDPFADDDGSDKSSRRATGFLDAETFGGTFEDHRRRIVVDRPAIARVRRVVEYDKELNNTTVEHRGPPDLTEVSEFDRGSDGSVDSRITTHVAPDGSRTVTRTSDSDGDGTHDEQVVETWSVPRGRVVEIVTTRRQRRSDGSWTTETTREEAGTVQFLRGDETRMHGAGRTGPPGAEVGLPACVPLDQVDDLRSWDWPELRRIEEEEDPAATPLAAYIRRHALHVTGTVYVDRHAGSRCPWWRAEQIRDLAARGISDATSAARPLSEGVDEWPVARLLRRSIDAPELTLLTCGPCSSGLAGDDTVDSLYVRGAGLMTAGGSLSPLSPNLLALTSDFVPRRGFEFVPYATVHELLHHFSNHKANGTARYDAIYSCAYGLTHTHRHLAATSTMTPDRALIEMSRVRNGDCTACSRWDGAGLPNASRSPSLDVLSWCGLDLAFETTTDCADRGTSGPICEKSGCDSDEQCNFPHARCRVQEIRDCGLPPPAGAAYALPDLLDPARYRLGERASLLDCVRSPRLDGDDCDLLFAGMPAVCAESCVDGSPTWVVDGSPTVEYCDEHPVRTYDLWGHGGPELRVVDTPNDGWHARLREVGELFSGAPTLHDGCNLDSPLALGLHR